MFENLTEKITGIFDKLKGKGIEKKFLTWISKNMESKEHRFKLAIKEEMESSKYGIF